MACEGGGGADGDVKVNWIGIWGVWGGILWTTAGVFCPARRLGCGCVGCGVCGVWCVGCGVWGVWVVSGVGCGWCVVWGVCECV